MNRSKWEAHLAIHGWRPVGTLDWCGLACDDSDIGVYLFITDKTMVVRRYTGVGNNMERAWDSITDNQLIHLQTFIKREGL